MILSVVTCGVPKSILGSLLLIYVNNITTTTTTSLFEIILFADDNTLLYFNPEIVSKSNVINKELGEISNWFRAKCL